MILIDSSVWIDFFNGKTTPQVDWLDQALGKESIVLGDLILAEVLQGFRLEKDFRTARNLMLRFPVMTLLGQRLALKSAENYRFLRAKGVTLRKTNNVIIGTFCIDHKIPLLHDDRDFKPLEKHLKLMTIQPKRSS